MFTGLPTGQAGRVRALFGAALVIPCLFSLGCSHRTGGVPVGEAQLIRYSHSDTCVGSLSSDSAEVEIIVDGREITVVHKNALLNCCLDSILVDFTQQNSLLRLTEMEVVPRPCDCLCPFEVRATIEVSLPGTYIIEIWTGDVMVWRGVVEVGGE